MDELELAKILMNIEMFEGLDYGQIEKIVNSGQQRVLAPGDVLSEPLTVDDQLSVFLDGKLRIESADGVPLSEVKEVRVLGEMGVLTGQARACSTSTRRSGTCAPSATSCGRGWSSWRRTIRCWSEAQAQSRALTAATTAPAQACWPASLKCS